MKKFTGWQYLLIDAANTFGHDKELFETRIKWAEQDLSNLERLTEHADNKALFIKATQAIRKAQKGLPTGHLMGLDGVCSGMQIMSAITGCHAGAAATGLIDTGERPDAYTSMTQVMNEILDGGVTIPRADAKRATMTSLYGSKAEPKKLFGDETLELHAFYQAMTTVAPGAWGLLQDLLNSWQPFTLAHAWKLPDGFDALVKVMEKFECRIEVDELDSEFVYEYQDNVGCQKGISLAANVVHSIDAYVLRSVHRRCNYDREIVEEATSLLSIVDSARALSSSWEHQPIVHPKVSYYVNLWKENGMVDAVILPYITAETALQIPQPLLLDLLNLSRSMLRYQPFPVVAIHDEFKCGPNHMNHLRQVYIDIMAELADSKILDYIMSTIHGKPVVYDKLSNNLSREIRKSNYALC